MLYLLTKLLYCANSVGQLFLLAEMIGDGYIGYGIIAFQDIIKKKYHNSKMFPRVTLCDVQMRQFSNVQMYTVQCALPINLFNEKIYLFIWFWLCLLSLANFYSLLSIIWRAFIPNRRNFIKHCMYSFNVGMAYKMPIIKEKVSTFVNNYLRQDGVLILRMIESNTNDAITAEIVVRLYERFLRHQLRMSQEERRQRLDKKTDKGPSGKLLKYRSTDRYIV